MTCPDPCDHPCCDDCGSPMISDQSWDVHRVRLDGHAAHRGRAGRLVRSTYVLYGTGRRALYVGCSANVDKRLRDHRYTKTWWKDVRRVERQEWPTEVEGWQAEIRLIRELRPVYNVAYNSDPRPGTCNIPGVLSHALHEWPAGTPLVIIREDTPTLWRTIRIGDDDPYGQMAAEWSIIREGATRPWLPDEAELALYHHNSYAYHWWRRDAPLLAEYMAELVPA